MKNPYGISKSEKGIAEGSVFDVAKSQNIKLEEAIANADVVVLIDSSSSMGLMSGDKTRYEKAVEALERVQSRYRGRVLIISFSDFAKIEYGGVPSKPGGWTDLVSGLEIAQPFDGTDMEFIVISDGEPNDQEGALAIARTYTDKISTIFIGDEISDRGGLEFMNRLAGVGRGKALGKVDLDTLGSSIVGLLGDGS